MFIYVVPGSSFVVNRPPLNQIFPEWVTVRYDSHIDIFSHGTCRPWEMTQQDVVANDWEVVDPFDDAYLNFLDDAAGELTSVDIDKSRYTVLGKFKPVDGEERVYLSGMTHSELDEVFNGRTGIPANIFLTPVTAISMIRFNEMGSNLERAPMGAVVSSGYIGRLFCVPVWTDALLPVWERVIKQDEIVFRKP